MFEQHFSPGLHISDAALLLVEAAAEHGEARGRFNDIEVIARSGDTVAGVMAEWEAKWEAASAAYRASPKGQAAETARQARRRDLQARHDALMDRLSALDFKDDAAVLDWLCEMQEPANHIDVISRTDTIVAKFEAAGFKASVNCGPDYRPGDRDNMFRYLVGQALDGFQRVGAPHSILIKFAGEWKAQFVNPK